MRYPATAAFRLSPPLVARPLTRLAIRSGKSHPGLQTQPQPARHRLESHRSRAIRSPGRYGRVRAVRDYPSNAATCNRAVPTGIHSTELPGDRRVRHKREPSLDPRRPARKTALKASRKVIYRPEECLGSHGSRPPDSAVWSRIVTIRHPCTNISWMGQGAWRPRHWETGLR